MAITLSSIVAAERSVSFVALVPDDDLLPLNDIADAAVAAGASESSAIIQFLRETGPGIDDGALNMAAHVASNGVSISVSCIDQPGEYAAFAPNPAQLYFENVGASFYYAIRIALASSIAS